MVDEHVLSENVSDCMAGVAYAIKAFQAEQLVFSASETAWETMDVARDKLKARMLDLAQAMHEYAREV